MVLPVSSSDLRSLSIQFHPPPPRVLNLLDTAAAMLRRAFELMRHGEPREPGLRGHDFPSDARETFRLVLAR